MTNAIEGDMNGDAPGKPPAGALGPIDQESPRGAIRSIATGAGRLFADLLGRIVHGIRWLAPLVLGVGLSCQSTNDPVQLAPPAAAISQTTSEPAREAGPRELGKFTITFYYVVGEDEIPSKSASAKPAMIAANDNRTGDGSGVESDPSFAAINTDRVTLYSGTSCNPIADVSKEFAQQIALQGTGKLRDGRVVNIFGACNCKRSPCFKVTQAQWGTSGSGKPLQPFRTIAVDPKVVKLGSLLYVPLLEGRLMPGRAPWGGYVHDGCVVADDTGGHINGNRIDLFVGRKAYFVGLGRSSTGSSHAWARHVPVFDGSGICERKGRQIGRKSASI
jgi:3D (Asp-Asp-Asp) domain-containing protein